MFPTAKTAVNKLVVNNKTQIVDLTQGNFTTLGATKAVTYGDNVLCDFAITQWEINAQNTANIGLFEVTDNSGRDYYKQYFNCLTEGDVVANDLWRTTTKYNIQVGV
jgi:hypothetical protein